MPRVADNRATEVPPGTLTNILRQAGLSKASTLDGHHLEGPAEDGPPTPDPVSIAVEAIAVWSRRRPTAPGPDQSPASSSRIAAYLALIDSSEESRIPDQS